MQIKEIKGMGESTGVTTNGWKFLENKKYKARWDKYAWTVWGPEIIYKELVVFVLHMSSRFFQGHGVEPYNAQCQILTCKFHLDLKMPKIQNQQIVLKQ